MGAFTSIRLVILFTLLLDILITEVKGDHTRSLKRRRREESSEFDWSYTGKDNGPDKWVDLGYKDCGGDKQSPIFYKGNETDWIYVPPFKFSDGYFMERNDAVLSNNGKWVIITLDEDENVPYFENGGMNEKFYFERVLFHFGSENDAGAEHTWSKYGTPETRFKSAFEIQMFHRNEKKTLYFVLHVVFTIGKENYYNISKGLEPVLNSLPDITEVDSSTTLKNFNLSLLIPGGLGSTFTEFYYRYNGSLAYPPCTENVIWNLFRMIESKIDVNKVEKFRQVKGTPEEGNDDTSMANNIRPMQDLNGRIFIDRNPNKP